MDAPLHEEFLITLLGTFVAKGDIGERAKAKEQKTTLILSAPPVPSKIKLIQSKALLPCPTPLKPKS